MGQPFEFTVAYKGKELSFTGSLVTMGYTYRIVVPVHGIEVNFEPDEERNFRAVLPFGTADASPASDKYLLQEIAVTLERLIK